MNIRQKALLFATRAHQGQKRKDGKQYITHPVAVAEIAEKMVKDEGLLAEEYLDDVYVVSLLHDVWEDTDISIIEIMKEFGPYVADCVIMLSRQPATTYYDFINYIAGQDDPLPMIVKLADLKHNMSDLPEGSLKDKYRFAYAVLIQAVM